MLHAWTPATLLPRCLVLHVARLGAGDAAAEVSGLACRTPGRWRRCCANRATCET